MFLTLQKIGNSSMITIPAKIINEAKLEVGDKLNIEYKGDRIEIYMPHKEIQKERKLGDISGTLEAENFDFEESMKIMKEGGYERYSLS